jgi:hypothetical protein
LNKKGVEAKIMLIVLVTLLVLLFMLVFAGQLLKGAGQIISKILGF